MGKIYLTRIDRASCPLQLLLLVFSQILTSKTSTFVPRSRGQNKKNQSLFSVISKLMALVSKCHNLLADLEIPEKEREQLRQRPQCDYYLIITFKLSLLSLFFPFFGFCLSKIVPIPWSFAWHLKSFQISFAIFIYYLKFVTWQEILQCWDQTLEFLFGRMRIWRIILWGFFVDIRQLVWK